MTIGFVQEIKVQLKQVHRAERNVAFVVVFFLSLVFNIFDIIIDVFKTLSSM